jgi:hypothetical protein
VKSEPRSEIRSPPAGQTFLTLRQSGQAGGFHFLRRCSAAFCSAGVFLGRGGGTHPAPVPPGAASTIPISPLSRNSGKFRPFRGHPASVLPGQLSGQLSRYLYRYPAQQPLFAGRPISLISLSIFQIQFSGNSGRSGVQKALWSISANPFAESHSSFSALHSPVNRPEGDGRFS